ncbi:CDP-alcohol phosphatidyltransferase family protein [Flavobacterium chuncheonense]|uniref:CDP-alcohol phosphatidyltransferase family protein n=1 Tax=Flavobacterium chuncheonense TaxID=2026653 RepID=A0ABW5YPD7_9FLAO
MQKLPIVLLYSRLAIGCVIIVFSVLQLEYYSFIAVLLLSIGLLTDIFDGIIARKYNVSSEKLRRLDSTIDQFFFIAFTIATYIQCPEFFKSNALKLLLLIGVESLTYAVSYIKFKKEIATHTIGAKLWTLVLFATLVQIIIQGESVILFNLCFWLGLATRIEIIGIIIALKKWTNDVPSFYHALQLRKGKAIKRHKLFNG